jgi:Ni2+-binding GTPase involved in maturation of urease and hydrogenase
MKTNEIMTRHPLTMRTDERPEDLSSLLSAARVHHMPLVDEHRLVGMWLATDDGPLALLGADTVYETTPESDAFETVNAILSGKEAAVVWDGDHIEGIVTRSDALRIVRSALDQGVGRRGRRPIVMRFVGPAGAGKTTVLLRTLPLLRECEAGIIEANLANASDLNAFRSAHVVVDPHAHWRKGFEDAVKALGEIEVVLMEDRDAPLEVDRGIGESFQILVVPANDAGAIPLTSLHEAQALLLTKVDLVSGQDLTAIIARIHEVTPGLEVIPVAVGIDDRGIPEWREWIERHVMPCIR